MENEAQIAVIAGWVISVAGGALLLAEGISATSLGVTFGLFWWGLASCGVIAGLDRIRRWELRDDLAAIVLMTLMFPLAAFFIWVDSTSQRLRLRTPQHEHRIRMLIVAFNFFIALWFWVIGVEVILQLEPFWVVAGMMAGPAFLAGAAWLFNRLRRNYAQFVGAGQFNQVLIHLLGSLGLAAAGLVILWAALFLSQTLS